ncbi:arylsulfatase [Crateriforma conspicua]|uniref:Arylsulfatase n=1 Tax=Crateriforma conspicua TaxID=2527996 RepID=A0A5C6FXT1_9PLAN|nr:arylsulfatase [Crateriforma conspicua]TWU65843.1 Arylsulfatase [Crateriforma conspicua]
MNHRKVIAVFCVAFSLFSVFAVQANADANDPKTKQPNIIFILCDDLGWGDLSVYDDNRSRGGKDFQTPSLDQMAQDGAQLRNHYCPAPVCAPSRASLLLGKHQGSADIRDNQFDKQLPPKHSVASVLKSAGYRTAIIGKYGLQGDQRYALAKNGTKPAQWPGYPTNRGFDEFLGYVRHVDGHLHYPAHAWELGNSDSHKEPKEVWHNDREISGDLTNCYTTDLFTAYAKHWISEQVRQDSVDPFFLYLAYDTPHAALQIPSCQYPDSKGLNGGVQWTGKPGAMINTAKGPIDSYRYPQVTNQGWSDVEERFASMVLRIDDAVGDLLQTLKDLGIDQNTLVVLSSDNGPHHESYLADASYQPTSFRSYGPFDGTKRDVWEGGVRVPTVAYWPGKIPSGHVDQQPSQFHDWMATFADAANCPVPAGCDGVSLLPGLIRSGTRQNSTVYVEYSQNGRTPDYQDFQQRKRKQKRGQMQIVFVDGYKGVRLDIDNHDDDFQIYDLENDPKELNDLAGSSDAISQIQQKMKDRVLRLRTMNESAKRPYDTALVPSMNVADPKPGAIMEYQIGEFPYVPKDLAAGHGRVFLTSYHRDRKELDAVNSTAAVWFRGYLRVPDDGSYRFRVVGLDRVAARLHEMLLLEHDPPAGAGDSAAKEPVVESPTVHLASGMHPIAIGTVVHPSDSQWKLQWSFQNGDWIDVPDDSFVIESE